ncbi:COG0779: clustered with transcription termination protein NusA [Crocosphaera watsonii WH 0005]|uniref:Ribosome maturation factor RimP n=1 Tax=Crocosphaera watsonii WH 0005 TaxID=423472 RepID=T2IU02_CROWT|nr:COG0779: clustered with transcription termination protein NusA [Crocosphaera watsonii WH 0005]
MIPQIIDLATPIAQEMGLEIVDVVFQTNKRPPVLRVDIRNTIGDTSLNDCEKVSRALESILDERAIMPGAYVLEISSPGISRYLSSERDFIAFKGFEVKVTTNPPYMDKKEWQGRLQGRDEKAVYLNRKGRAIAVPCSVITQVQLAD